MKTFSIALFCIMTMSWAARASDEWTHTAEMGMEDTTSRHYCFFRCGGSSVTRVRWLLNGGAQSAPTATDYVLGSGKIIVRRYVGKRESLEELIAGGDADLELTEEYSISARKSTEMLIPPAPDKHLTDKQRVDLKNLIDLLAKNRKPITGEAEAEGNEP